MKPLIDTDILLYECSSVAEHKDEPIKGFAFVEEVFLNKVEEICRAVGATEEPILYLTGKGNFREEVAVTKPYKGTRTQEKPFHYKNLKAYIRGLPNCVEVEGMEADDAMAIEQTSCNSVGKYCPVDGPRNTVICTRDKDLRMVPGWHYGWECGKQPEFKLQWVDEIGEIHLIEKVNAKGKVSSEIKGTGLKFFYSQLITGDKVDDIPGLKGCGSIAAFCALRNCKTEREMYEAVENLYREKAEYPLTLLYEQAYLLWMVRELDEEGEPVMWREPDDRLQQ